MIGPINNSIAVTMAVLMTGVAVFAQEGVEYGPEKPGVYPLYQTSIVPYQQVRMTGGLWKQRQETMRDVSIPWMTKHLDVSGGLDAYKADPEHYEVKPLHALEYIKAIEALGYLNGLYPDSSLVGMTDRWTGFIMDRQAEDGYLQWPWERNADEGSRWTNDSLGHILYATGHYFESSLAVYQSTGNWRILDSGIKGLDCVADGYNPKYDRVSGHAEAEVAAMRLYGMTGDKKYLELCRYLLDQRGTSKVAVNAQSKFQNHMPFRDQRRVWGHAVRCHFLWAGATDLVGATGDENYREAANAAWRSMVDEHMYITGGTGVLHAHNEGYGDPFTLPPNGAYAESCSGAIAVLWATRMHRLNIDSEHYDIAERILYNTFLSSMSLHGDRMFYQNRLQCDQGGLFSRKEWHPCPCCPPNITKLILSLGGYFYTTAEDGIYVNLYGANEADLDYGAGKVKLVQETNYPWDGKIRVTVNPSESRSFKLRFRIPGWADSHSVRLNGSAVDVPVEQGYAVLERLWQKGDCVELDFPMEIKRMHMPKPHKYYNGLVAIQSGPVVYCLEEADNGPDLASVCITDQTAFSKGFRPDLLEGVNVIKASNPDLTFVPFYAWNNRGDGTMRVWLFENEIPEVHLSSSQTAIPEATETVRDGIFPVDGKNAGSKPFILNREWRLKDWDAEEWLQLDFPNEETFSQASVCFYKDDNVGLPKAWRIESWQEGKWNPVQIKGDYPIEADKLIAVQFEPLKTRRIRLVLAGQQEFSKMGVHEWIVGESFKPVPSASFVHPSSTLAALNDGLLPGSSDDKSIPRYVWWAPTRLGTQEWVEYTFPVEQTFSSTEVYWFDDGRGCAVPETWNLQYFDLPLNRWIDVKAAGDYGIERNAFNRVEFVPVSTTTLRIQVQSRPNKAGGILEWKLE